MKSCHASSGGWACLLERARVMLVAGLTGLFVGLANADESEVEGDIWYDSNGEVVWVDGPAAEPLPPPFVPEWKQREHERRANQAAPWRSQSRDYSRSQRTRYHYFSYPHYYYGSGFRGCPHGGHRYYFHGSHSGFHWRVGY